ncbi:MAG: AAA family ATPase [Planctomycetota bacterium]
MRTVAIINQKGGCGKTTSAINLAACLAKLGHKTLLVDMDPQGHCATGLAVPEEQIERTILDALIEEGDVIGKVPTKPSRITDLVWQIASDFDLAPSNVKLAAFEPMFAGRPGRELRLHQALEAVADKYEWCVVDCPPGVGALTFNALYAADECIVPVETGYFSLHGLARMLETLDELKEIADKSVAVRILPTMYDTRTKLAREVLAELRQRFGDSLMKSVVNFNTKLKEAASFGQPITEYDPGSRGFKDFVSLARELMGTPAETPTAVAGEPMSRPAELVQRARQLAQLANKKFGGSEQVFTREPAPQAEAEAPVPEAVIQRLPDKTPSASTKDKLEAIYGVRQVGGSVEFACQFDDAETVMIAGDFNNWSAVTPMTPGTRPGMFKTVLPLAPGRYRYRLIVDGDWVTDPHNTYVEANQFGELNNIVEVG